MNEILNKEVEETPLTISASSSMESVKSIVEVEHLIMEKADYEPDVVIEENGITELPEAEVNYYNQIVAPDSVDSYKQAIVPQQYDVNELISRVDKMLEYQQKLSGEIRQCLADDKPLLERLLNKQLDPISRRTSSAHHYFHTILKKLSKLEFKETSSVPIIHEENEEVEVATESKARQTDDQPPKPSHSPDALDNVASNAFEPKPILAAEFLKLPSDRTFDKIIRLFLKENYSIWEDWSIPPEVIRLYQRLKSIAKVIGGPQHSPALLFLAALAINNGAEWGNQLASFVGMNREKFLGEFERCPKEKKIPFILGLFRTEISRDRVRRKMSVALDRLVY